MGLGIGGVLEQLIGPPGGFLLLGLFGLLMLRRHQRLGMYLTASGFGLLYVASMPVTGQVLMNWLEPDTALSAEQVVQNTVQNIKPPQAIVILGAGRREDAVEYAGDTLDAFALERVRYGVWLARRTLLPILVSGGLADKEVKSEAELMKQLIESEYALPVRWIETESHNTYENAVGAVKIFKAEGIQSIYLVTHAYHMKRSMAAFKKVGEKMGLTVTAAPTVFKRRSKEGVEIRHFLPSSKALRYTALAFHEWVGMAWYWLRY
jgi:uncharacterized SAM-binding protein YcdF (DUF218 family)